MFQEKKRYNVLAWEFTLALLGVAGTHIPSLTDFGVTRMVKKLYVGNLPFSTNEDLLREHFAQFGEVHSVKLVTDRETGRLRGFGFVEMTDPEEARKAMDALNESMMGGRPIVVNEARQRQDRDRGGYNKRW